MALLELTSDAQIEEERRKDVDQSNQKRSEFNEREKVVQVRKLALSAHRLTRSGTRSAPDSTQA
jgi:hypothetical protein